MNFLHRIFDFYIRTNLHVGLAVLCLTLVTEKCAAISVRFPLHVFVFAGTVLTYNFLQYKSYFLTDFSRMLHATKLLATLLFAGVVSVYCLFKLNSRLQFPIFGVGLLVLSYPFFRRFGVLKMFFVSYCVTVVTVVFPYLQSGSAPVDFFLLVAQRFLIVISWLVPFEIADSKTDEPSLKTIPQRYGIVATKLFGFLLIIPFIMLEFFKADPSFLVLNIGITTALFIYFSKEDSSKYYTSFGVESIPIIWWLLLEVFD